VLLAGGAKGKRACLPNSRVLIHQPWVSGLGGQQSDVAIHALDLFRMRERLDEILAFHTGRPQQEVHADSERDRIFAAEEAVTYGLVDQVMKGRK
jgi:ATP-dependent Clp protease protease subunit